MDTHCIPKELAANETKIAAELIDCQGEAQKIEGYYMPTDGLTTKAMRPSKTLNAVLDGVLV